MPDYCTCKNNSSLLLSPDMLHKTDQICILIVNYHDEAMSKCKVINFGNRSKELSEKTHLNKTKTSINHIV